MKLVENVNGNCSDGNNGPDRGGEEAEEGVREGTMWSSEYWIHSWHQADDLCSCYVILIIIVGVAIVYIFFVTFVLIVIYSTIICDFCVIPATFVVYLLHLNVKYVTIRNKNMTFIS